MSAIVYHGGTDVIRHPDCAAGRDKLDFGRGFYLTENKGQAERWAKIIGQRRGEPALINVYRLDKKGVLAEYRCKIFSAYNADWLTFIVRCRTGYDASVDYDYIEGGVANDRVIDTVMLYTQGYITEEIALGNLAQHLPNDQICLLNQKLTDKYLIYDRTEGLQY